MSCPVTGVASTETSVSIGVLSSEGSVSTGATNNDTPIGPLPGLNDECGEDILLVGDLLYVGDDIYVMGG